MPSVLIVDDQPDSCRPLARLFRLCGHEAACAASGSEALRLIATAPPDVLILDVMMPGMDGWQVLRALRTDGRFDALPVLMFSALSDDAHHQQARELGAQGFFVKGRVGFDELRAVVESHLRPQ